MPANVGGLVSIVQLCEVSAENLPLKYWLAKDQASLRLQVTRTPGGDVQL
jgi:hypothetical protein